MRVAAAILYAFLLTAVTANDLGKYMMEKGAYGEFLRVQEEVNQLLPNHVKLKESTPLPHIVVVGMESVGKSSTLERIVGFPLFPRASGLCTRMPTELTTINDPNHVTPKVRKAA
jgi:hypothetical protein